MSITSSLLGNSGSQCNGQMLYVLYQLGGTYKRLKGYVSSTRPVELALPFSPFLEKGQRLVMVKQRFSHDCAQWFTVILSMKYL